MENMKLFNAVRSVPATAQKQIKGGRLTGMTDISPMWRIQTLTEQFGPCGVGWYSEITDVTFKDGSGGEQAAFVSINLYICYDGNWSKPISGTGGSKFIASEKSGLYTSDECIKMAETDALSVACKKLGMGADIYWQGGKDTKYTASDSAPEPRAVDKITPEQLAILTAGYTGETLAKLLTKNKVEKLTDLSYDRAEAIVTAYKSYVASKA